MPNYESYADLTRAVRLLKTQPTFLLDTFFKNSKTSTTGVVQFEKHITASGAAELSFDDNLSNIVEKQSKDMYGLKVPTTQESMFFSVKEYQEYKNPQNIIIDGDDSERLSAWEEFVFSNLEYLKNRAVLRQEIFAGQALTGLINYTSDRGDFSVDFGDVNNFSPSLAADKWGADTANPIELLIEMAQSVLSKSGLQANICLMGVNAAKAFRNNKIMIDRLDTLNFDVGRMKPFAAIDSVTGAAFLGKLPDANIEIYSYGYQYTSKAANGTIVANNILDPDTVIITSTQGIQAGIFEHVKGPITIFDEEATAVKTSYEYLANKYLSKNKQQIEYELQSCALPIVKATEAISLAKVL